MGCCGINRCSGSGNRELVLAVGSPEGNSVASTQHSASDGPLPVTDLITRMSELLERSSWKLVGQRGPQEARHPCKQDTLSLYV